MRGSQRHHTNGLPTRDDDHRPDNVHDRPTATAHGDNDGRVHYFVECEYVDDHIYVAAAGIRWDDRPRPDLDPHDSVVLAAVVRAILDTSPDIVTDAIAAD